MDLLDPTQEQSTDSYDPVVDYLESPFLGLQNPQSLYFLLPAVTVPCTKENPDGIQGGTVQSNSFVSEDTKQEIVISDGDFFTNDSSNEVEPSTLEKLNDEKLYYERPTRFATNIVKAGYRWYNGYTVESYWGLRAYDAEFMESVLPIPNDQKRSLGATPDKTFFLKSSARIAHVGNFLDVLSYGTGAAFDGEQLYRVYAEGEEATGL